MSTRADRLLARVEYVTDTLAIIALFVSMIAIAIDVFCRYALLRPLPWVTDFMVLYLLPGIFFLGLPGSYAKGSHIAVDLLCNYMSARVRLWLSLFARLMAFSVFLALAYYGAVRFADAVRLGEIQPAVGINWRLWPSVLLVPMGAGLTMLRAAERLFAETSLLGSGEEPILAYVKQTAQEEVRPE